MLSIVLVHPAKAVEWNEMTFDRDTRLVPSNVMLDRSPSPPVRALRGDLGSEPPVCRDATYAELLWVLFILSW